MLFAHLAHTFYNVIRLSGNKLEPLDVGAFIPKWYEGSEEEQVEVTQESLAAKAARVFGAFGGVDPSVS